MNPELSAGLVLVDKPAGVSSFAMVRAIRRLLGIKKVGHAGTLDPFATGLLVICIGRPATKMISALMDSRKEYVATLLLGRESTTHDPEGEITSRGPLSALSREQIETVLARFRGTISQIPPAFSALKHKGKPLYHYARQGICIEKEARQVQIHRLDWQDARELVDAACPTLTLRVECSKGTYIRTLAADIGAALGCGAYLTALRRTRSGIFSVADAVAGADFHLETAARTVQNRILSVDGVRNLLQ